MDASNGQKPVVGQPLTGGVAADKGKEWQMELLMEKLRSKASTFKSFMETAKNLRMAMLDKRFSLDSVEKNQLQKCLDTLQHSIKVTSLQSMVERLESLTRQLGLKFMMSGPPGTELFISSDMFFLEVLLEPTGVVKDVKIHHEGKNEQQSCEELVACLSRGDFVDFTTQLEGLASIYQLNADKKVKCKAFSALQSLEADLGVLAQLQTFIKEPFNLVHKSPVGILERRKGGHAMKLTYFASPYDLIDLDNRSCDVLSPEVVITRKIGHSVTVCMEGSTAHKLPTSSIITVNRSPSGKSTPSYAPLTGANSSMLPACFVLKLARKMPMCLELVRRIQKVTEMECGDVSTPHPLLSLIVQHASEGQLDCHNNRGLYVTLPDQQHCYFMTENKSMEGVLVGSIPFTHPAHVPQILVYLRQQALFNSLLSSCVRPMARQELEHTTMFEVSALSWQHISVSLEHPFEETMATAELDLTDISALKCKLYGVSMTNTEQTSELAARVLQRCLSIPVTMRTLIKTWEGRATLVTTSALGGTGGNYNVNLGPNRDQNGHGGSGMGDFNGGEVKIKQEPGLNGNGTIGRQQATSQQSFLDAGTESSIGFPSFSGQSDTTTAMLNPLQLGALLGQVKNSSSPTALPGPLVERPKKSRKRKTAEGGLWRSPKRKGEEPGEILLESSSSDSTPLGTPTGRDNPSEIRTPTPTSAAGLPGNLDLSGLDPADILGNDKSSDYDLENETEIMEVHDLQDVEELLKRERKTKKREEKKSPNIFEEASKSLVPPSVSITPISSSGMGPTTNYNSVLTGMGLERRPGIEIIPIASAPQASLPSSITITPIAGPNAKNLTDERRERKSSKSKSEERNKLEKKRKRKREDSPMGPPEKLPPKQDPLSKPVSVSIKPTESPPSLGSRPASPSTTLRKFSPSPTHTSPLALMGKSSPTLKQSVANKPVQSPKHSPVYNSPKHNSIPASASPKHGTSSPKHAASSTSAGKPSMSALKSAASSPSPGKGPEAAPAKPKSSARDPAREKERKTSSLTFGGSGHQSPKAKSSSGKLKQLDLTPSGETPPSLPSSGGSTPPSGGSDLGKSGTAQQQARNRKGSLSAVIDKLKNAQHCSEDGSNGSAKVPGGGNTGGGGAGGTATPAAPGTGQKDRGNSSNKVVDGKTVGAGGTAKNPSMDSKNPAEYMVKHSSDGMKITINKTRTKDSKSTANLKISSSSSSSSAAGAVSAATAASASSGSSSGSGNGSPKTHTGLKPGVNSGPASKKPQTQTSPKTLPGSSSGLGGGPKIPGISGPKMPATKSVTGGPLVKGLASKAASGSPKMTGSSGATDLSRNRDKPRIPKSGEKGVFGTKGVDARKSSPSAQREESESERAFKLLAAHASMSSLPSLPPQLVVEGLMKQLDTNFQIPKLSARVNAEGSDKKPSDKSLVQDASNPGSRGTGEVANKLLDGLGPKVPSEANKLQASLATPKLPQEEPRRDQVKSENLSAVAAAMSLNLGNVGPGGLMPPLVPASSTSSTPSVASAGAPVVANVSHDSDVPTNLSMQPGDAESRDACKDLQVPRPSQQFLNSAPVSGGKDDSTPGSKIGENLGKPVYPGIGSGPGNSESLNLSTKPADAASIKYTRTPEERKSPSAGMPGPLGPPTAITPLDVGATPKAPSSQEAAEMLLDFSTPKEVKALTTVPERAMTQAAPLRRNTPPPPPPAFPPSPSVSVHIVKSPAPSPRVVPPSPHSASPCITDDELMDEALVGMGK
ncbi:mediator of RNA polymerase II transcription subunit 1 [Orussus abietinus]|uniref:mediator of RNA polymerase II transcription subunit 1 n=1 Tax=Orussus abietinus TaxID=222816 RepID=UPI00062596A9|nr:mediator of RNA polymerase II transcription subunit 1 [Orussus abietinus]